MLYVLIQYSRKQQLDQEVLQHEIERLRAYIGDEISKKQERLWREKAVEQQEQNKVCCTNHA